jgi:hypothetical protein
MKLARLKGLESLNFLPLVSFRRFAVARQAIRGAHGCGRSDTTPPC